MKTTLKNLKFALGRDCRDSSEARRKHRLFKKLRFEGLENRLLLTFVPTSSPIDVSGVPIGPQFVQSQRVLAASATGSYAVVWDGIGSASNAVYVRLFNADGTVLSPEIHVDATNANDTQPTVAMNDNGVFAVAWTHSLGGSLSYVMAQVFNPDGTPQGNAYPFFGLAVRTTRPTVAMDLGRDFVIAYADSFAGSDYLGAYFVSSSGAETPLTLNAGGASVYSPSAAMNASGSFVIAYTLAFGSGYTESCMETFGPGGSSPSGPIPFQFDESSQPSAAINGSGAVVIAYTKFLETKPVFKTEIVGQRFDSLGNYLGTDVITSTALPGSPNLYDPSASIDAAGNYVVAYTTGGTPGPYDPSYGYPTVRGSLVTSAGVIQDTLLPISSNPVATAQKYDSEPSVTLTANDHLAAAWQNYGMVYTPELGGDGVFAQAFTTAPFRFELTSPPLLSLVAGIPATVNAVVHRDAGFTGAVSLTVLGMPAWITATAKLISVSAQGDNWAITFSDAAGVAPPPNLQYYALGIVASSNGLWPQTAPLELAFTPAFIGSISPTEGYAPQSLNPGTLVTIHGSGFIAGSMVEFADGPETTPNSIGSDGTSLTVRVPESAISGPITLIRPNGVNLVSPTSFTVHYYRDTNAFSFENFKFHISFPMVSDAYGYDATHVTVDDVIGPIGWAAKLAGVDATTPVPSPGALAFTAFAEAALGGDGACFGISLSSDRLLNEPSRITNEFDLPAGKAPTVFNVQPNGDLIAWIEQQHLYQFSAEAINYAAGWYLLSHDNASVYWQLHDALAAGDHPIISLSHGLTDGHAVVAYDLDGTPDDFNIRVYDSNREDGVIGSENQTVIHELADNTPIHVHNDAWSFTMSDNSLWSGALGLVPGSSSLMVIPSGVIPDQPTLPTSLAGIKTIFLGSLAHPSPVSLGAIGDLSVNGSLFASGSSNTLAMDTDSLGNVALTLNGQVYQYPKGSVTSITYYGGDADDTIDVERTSAAIPVTLYLGTGTDTVDLSPSAHLLQNIQGGLNISGGLGTDVLNVNDQANTAATTYSMTTSGLSTSRSGTIQYQMFDRVNIYGGSGNDIYNVTGTEQKFTTTLAVGAGAAVNVKGTTGPLVIQHQTTGSAAVNVGGANAGLDGIHGGLRVSGNGADSLMIDDALGSGLPTNLPSNITSLQSTRSYTLTGGDLNRTASYGYSTPDGGGGGTSYLDLLYTGIANVELDGSNLGGTLSITGTSAPTLIKGGAGPTSVFIGGAGNAQGILGPLSIEDPAGVRIPVAIDDSADAIVRTATLTSISLFGDTMWDSLKGLAPADINFERLETADVTIKSSTGPGRLGVDLSMAIAGAAGGLSVTSGKLIVAGAKALPDGAGLTVGSGIVAFDRSSDVPASGLAAPDSLPVFQSKSDSPSSLAATEAIPAFAVPLLTSNSALQTASPSPSPSAGMLAGPAAEGGVVPASGIRIVGGLASLRQSAVDSVSLDSRRAKDVAILALEAVFAQYGE
jgi:hypothetical protein